MPTKRTRVARNIGQRITEAAIEAYIARDYIALHRALGLKPWEASPLPLEDEPLGVDQDSPPEDGSPWGETWPQAQELQRELEAAVRRRTK